MSNADHESRLVFGPKGRAYRWSSYAIGTWVLFWGAIALWQAIANS